jgi:predicted phosphate transport protein (TIGR00153 family)
MAKSFLSSFTPKEPKFFPLLKQMSDVLTDASGLLVECLKSPTYEGAVEIYKQIKEKEHEGDSFSNKIFEALNSTFITPFDREDIDNLADKMDDVIDGINSCGKRIVLYKPKTIPTNTLELAVILSDAAKEIAAAVDELDVLKKNPTHIKQYCDNLNRIEKRGDEVYEQQIRELFNGDIDAIEVIKLKEIAYELERTIDVAERVGKIIKTIIVKYA